MKRRVFAVVWVPSIILGACGRGESSGPPELRLGRDECAECGMSIIEERSAAAVLADRGGRRDALVFDDIGCLLDFEMGTSPGMTVIQRYVHDHGSGDWVVADRAVFLVTDGSTLRTPMASGIAAYAGRDHAQAGRTAHGGEIVGFGDLLARRRAPVPQAGGSSGK